MAIADGAENPRTIALVGVFFRIEDSRHGEIPRVHLSVFRMYVKDAIPQHADGGDGVDALPEHMAGIVIATDRFPRNRAQAQHGFRVVNHEPGMHFDGDFHAVVSREPAVFLPVRRDAPLPLPLEQVEIFGWPRASDPVRIFSLVAVAGTSGEVDHHWDAQACGQFDRAAAYFPMRHANLPVGMERISVAAPVSYTHLRAHETGRN